MCRHGRIQVPCRRLAAHADAVDGRQSDRLAGRRPPDRLVSRRRRRRAVRRGAVERPELARQVVRCGDGRVPVIASGTFERLVHAGDPQLAAGRGAAGRCPSASGRGGRWRISGTSLARSTPSSSPTRWRRSRTTPPICTRSSGSPGPCPPKRRTPSSDGVRSRGHYDGTRGASGAGSVRSHRRDQERRVHRERPRPPER